jgi:hypothetical protein
MQRPQKLVAAFLSAALLCTTGIAFADKGGNHDKKGSSPQGQSSAPGQSGGPSAQRGPGGMGGPQISPGAFDRSMNHNRTMGDGSRGSEFEGSADGIGAGAKAGVHIKLANGATHDFDISAPALNSLKARQDHGGQLIFFANGQQITAVCNRGEKDNMRVTARTGDTFTLQDQTGQTRLINLDSKTANRLHVRVGSNVQVTALSATSGKIVALDLVKKHDFDKFSGSRGVEAAKLDVDRQKVDFDTQKLDNDRAKSKSTVDVDVAKVDSDRRDVDIDQVKLDIDKAKGNKTDVDADQRKLDVDKQKIDRDVAQADVDAKKAKKSDVDVAKTDVDVDRQKVDIDQQKLDIDTKKGKKADIDVDKQKLDIDVAKLDIDSKGKKAKKSDVDVANADVDTKGRKAKKSKSDVDVAATSGGMGKCGHGSSRNGNPAFANQMAKDAANDASGHNPPGLPHECVNPAGHTRGFCKSSSGESICGGGMGSGGGETDVAANISKPCAPGASSKNHSNPAFANQMAKDAANDASGHNPPGLPHECVNPAGHTRGFCKSSESSSPAMCGGGSSGGISPTDLHGGISAAPVGSNGSGRNAVTPVRGFQAAPVNGSGGSANAGTSVRGFQPSAVNGSGGSANAGTSVRGFRPGVAPVGGSAAGAPTHVLGSSTGPTSGRRIAALPTRVLPVAIQPVGKRRCVWYKTGVLGASTGPRYIVGTSAIAGKPVLHKKCR